MAYLEHREYLKTGFKQSDILKVAEVNNAILDDFKKKNNIKTDAELAGHKYLNCSRMYIYKLRKGIRVFSPRMRTILNVT